MKNVKFPVMAPIDERQFMLNEDFEIWEKFGVPVGAVQMHSHDFYELLYIEEGEFEVLVDNQIYDLGEGDFLLIDRTCLHRYQFMEKKHETARRLLLWVSKEYLQSLSGDMTDLTACFSAKGAPAWHFQAEQSRRLISWLYRMRESLERTGSSEAEKKLLKRSYMTLFFIELNGLCCQSDLGSAVKGGGAEPLVRQVFEYIDSHIGEQITVDDLANELALSKFYFLRRFKEMTGMTVHDVVVKKRLMHACHAIEAGKSISTVWTDCGFSDYSSFFRNFKSTYGMSPREYRMKCEEK